MTTREALILWVKYNHMILNKQQLDIKQIIHFQKIKDDLIRQGIQSIQIQEIKKDRYIIEYQKQSLKKKDVVYFNEINNIDEDKDKHKF